MSSTVRVRPATVGAAPSRHVVSTEEDLTERHPKVGAEYRVDDRVQETIEVAEPQREAEQQRRVVALVAAERARDGDDEEGKPA